MPDILHKVIMDASPEDVYRAITEEEGVRNWWTKDCSIGNEIGAVAEFHFNRGRVTFRMRIDELEKPERIVWYCLDGDPEWEDTRLVFEIYETSGKTVLEFSHLDWRSTDGIFAMCSYDWARYLASLKSYVETGAGQPHAG